MADGEAEDRQQQQAREDREDWFDYRRLVLSQIQALQKDLSSIRTEVQTFRTKDIGELKIEIALLKLKTAMWGAILGAIGGGVIAFVVSVGSKLFTTAAG